MSKRGCVCACKGTVKSHLAVMKNFFIKSPSMKKKAIEQFSKEQQYNMFSSSVAFRVQNKNDQTNFKNIQT